MADQSARRCRIGLVGINPRARRVILPGFSQAPHGEVTAVCSRDRAKAEQVASEIGDARAYDDYQAMLATAPIDAVFLNTPDETHYPLAMAALAAGKDVVCEKPLATTLAEAVAMAGAARETGRLGLVNFTYRSVTPHRHVARLLADGAIGRLLSFDVSFWQSRLLLGWGSPAAALLDVGSHLFDTIEWWAEAAGAGPVVEVCCQEGHADVITVRASDPGAPVWQAMVRLRESALGVLQCSRVTPGHRNAITATWRGDRGSLTLQFETDVATISLARPGVGSPEGDWKIVPPPDDLVVSYAQFPGFHFGRIVDALLGLDDFPTFDEGLRCQRLIAASEASLAEHRWVVVPDVR
ncbi:MAG: Gfo/Idh/MocA family oxidoreductase [Chloroflexi bacterium]|nr:Gfo/Idh/MocA family oxidoreductase [Chloroflexota bacterium]